MVSGAGEKRPQLKWVWAVNGDSGHENCQWTLETELMEMAGQSVITAHEDAEEEALQCRSDGWLLCGVYHYSEPKDNGQWLTSEKAFSLLGT